MEDRLREDWRSNEDPNHVQRGQKSICEIRQIKFALKEVFKKIEFLIRS